MVTRIKHALVLTLCAAGFAAAAAAVWICLEAKALPDIRPLIDPSTSIRTVVRGWNGHTAPFTVGPRNRAWTPLDQIPDHLRKAVLAGEDFNFYTHAGVDWYEVCQSFRRNLRERRFARGASTITQQLAKNLFLSREKTIRRKVRELILTRRLEKTLTKDRILELYLNVVEMGDMVYGVGPGAQRHFGKNVSDITPREGAFLAAMLPGPRIYDPQRHLERVMNRSDHILGVMLKGGWITEEEYLKALVEIPAPYGQAKEADNKVEDRTLFKQRTAEAPEALEPVSPDPGEAEGGTNVQPRSPDTGEKGFSTGREGIVEIPVGE